MDKYLSFVVCSRDRFDMLKELLETYQNLCSYPENIEILVAIDNDDREYLERVSELYDSITKIDLKVVIFEKRYGWEGHYKYYNQMAKMARGEWIGILGDDARVTVDGWDKGFYRFRGKFFLLTEMQVGDKERVAFPVFPRKLVDICNKISDDRHLDAYLVQFFRKLAETLFLKVDGDYDYSISDSLLYVVPEYYIRHIKHESDYHDDLRTEVWDKYTINKGPFSQWLFPLYPDICLNVNKVLNYFSDVSVFMPTNEELVNLNYNHYYLKKDVEIWKNL